jgi:hypothetical protein
VSNSNVAEKSAAVAEVVSAPMMTIVKDEPVEARKLSLAEKIQRIEDLSILIDRGRALAESGRKLQTFQIGVHSLSSVTPTEPSSRLPIRQLSPQ